MTTSRRNRRGGRDMAALLSDFGHDLPTIPALEREAKEPRIFKYAPRRGAARGGRGWAAARCIRLVVLPRYAWAGALPAAKALVEGFHVPSVQPSSAEL